MCRALSLAVSISTCAEKAWVLILHSAPKKQLATQDYMWPGFITNMHMATYTDLN